VPGGNLVVETRATKKNPQKVGEEQEKIGDPMERNEKNRKISRGLNDVQGWRKKRDKRIANHTVHEE